MKSGSVGRGVRRIEHEELLEYMNLGRVNYLYAVPHLILT